MMKKMFILFLPTLILSVTDPFSNVSENFKDISVCAIAIKDTDGNREACALLNIKGETELVSPGSIISNGKWKILKIEKESILTRHLASGKEYCINI
jgi:hypothetical protein